LYYQYTITTQAESSNLLADERQRDAKINAIHSGKLTLYDVMAPLLAQNPPNLRKKAKEIIGPFFAVFDTDHSNDISVGELTA
jgi:hypothetical protein